MKQPNGTQCIDPNVTYILGDADQIRRTIEAYLFSHDLEGLGEFSKTLTEAITHLAVRAERLGAQVIFAGGDDVLFSSPPNKLVEADLRDLMRAFEEETSCTISVGVGKTLEEAFTNLAKAKASGPGTLFFGDTPSSKEELKKRYVGRRARGAR